MGNYISSCSYIHPIPKFKSPKSARVVFPYSEIRQFRDPSTNAAELMLDCPDHFLVNVNSLTIGRRFSPLSADEELEFGNLYVMVPMRRLNSVVTAAEVAGFFMLAAKSGPKRILPMTEVNESTADDGGESDHEDQNGRSRLSLDGDGYNKYRLSVCGSRRPGLDTIMEEPACVF